MTFRTVVALLLALALTTGCKLKKRSEPSQVDTTGTPIPSPNASGPAVGDKVDVLWNGKWWKAEILAVDAGLYRVHYTGWSSKWDETVTMARIRPPSSTANVGTEQSPVGTVLTGWKAGDRVDVLWNGTWWQAQIMSVSGATYRVHYIGWSSSWDETVGASRVRAWSGSGRKGSG